MQYFDKNGVEIKAGMTIRMEDDSLELVYDTTDSYGNPDLGINASNEEYLELHPFRRVRYRLLRHPQPAKVIAHHRGRCLLRDFVS